MFLVSLTGFSADITAFCPFLALPVIAAEEEGDISHRVSREALEKPCTRRGEKCAQGRIPLFAGPYNRNFPDFS